MAVASYGGSLHNLMLMQDDQHTDTLVAMLGSCSPHISLQHVSRSMGGFEEASFGGQKRGLYSYAARYGEGGAELEPGCEDGDELGGDELSPGGHVEKKRRLSFDQVRALERNFEVDNKLEPERKMQLAKELGLQPRQVAVWFQNRRARWKIKQLERDFEALTQDYHRLQADMDAVTRDKKSLKAQVNRLKGIQTDDDSATPGECEQCRPSGDRPASPTQSDRSDIEDPARSSLSPAADYPADSAPTAAGAAAGPVKSTASSDSMTDSGLTDSPCSSDMSRDELQPRALDTSCCGTRNNNNNNNNNSSSSYPGEWAQLAPESFVGPHLMVPDPLADDQLLLHVASFHDVHRGAGAVKAEDNMEHAFLLSRLDDQPVLPSWWDWA